VGRKDRGGKVEPDFVLGKRNQLPNFYEKGGILNSYLTEKATRSVKDLENQEKAKVGTHFSCLLR